MPKILVAITLHKSPKFDNARDEFFENTPEFIWVPLEYKDDEYSISSLGEELFDAAEKAFLMEPKEAVEFLTKVFYGLGFPEYFAEWFVEVTEYFVSTNEKIFMSYGIESFKNLQEAE